MFFFSFIVTFTAIVLQLQINKIDSIQFESIWLDNYGQFIQMRLQGHSWTGQAGHWARESRWAGSHQYVDVFCENDR